MNNLASISIFAFSYLIFYCPAYLILCDFSLPHLLFVQGQSIIPMLTGEVIPVMELLSSMKSHSVPEEIDVSYFIK